MIKTVGDLRKILNNLDDDYKLDIRIMKEIPEEELDFEIPQKTGLSFVTVCSQICHETAI